MFGFVLDGPKRGYNIPKRGYSRRKIGFEVRHQIFEFLGRKMLGSKFLEPQRVPMGHEGHPLANTEIAIFINDFIMKSMLFRHVWIWTDLANGVRRFQGFGFGGHKGSRI